MIELGKVPDFNSQNTVTREKRISMKGHTRGPDDLSVLSKFGSFSKKKQNKYYWLLYNPRTDINHRFAELQITFHSIKMFASPFVKEKALALYPFGTKTFHLKLNFANSVFWCSLYNASKTWTQRTSLTLLIFRLFLRLVNQKMDLDGSGFKSNRL